MQKLVSGRNRIEFEDKINKLFKKGWELVPHSLVMVGAIDWAIFMAVVKTPEEKIENNPNGFL